jgi:hypothetical protein
MTPQGLKRRATLEAAHASVDGPESLNPWERCITRGLPAVMLPSAYNNYLQLVQTPGFVVIVTEMIHEARIVPVDGRPHLPPPLRAWMGDSRGRWEGDTLVVDTTNFSDEADLALATNSVSRNVYAIDERSITASPSRMNTEKPGRPCPDENRRSDLRTRAIANYSLKSIPQHARRIVRRSGEEAVDAGGDILTHDTRAALGRRPPK